MTDLLAYTYVKLVLEQEFPVRYLGLINGHNLHYELTSMIELCAPLLIGLEEDDPFLRYELIGIIAVYLQELEPDN
ncbi:hypothetical protein [Mucilaginibacter rubeus]|uniref:hypothetical protein n=1 Tax=Mucilaginibacter rubeus TaxID=2027860 RepID=UPI0016645A72|nr:hypothetical protein [Mucilaginibacter rubeus]GGA95415.1 hypothetical protein GCM10011500_09060 [Mucilaginibacter rubeus]